MTSKNPWDGVLRQRLSRRRLLAAGLAVGAASTAAACGGGEEAQPPKPTSSISAYTRYSLPPERRPTVEAAAAHPQIGSREAFGRVLLIP